MRFFTVVYFLLLGFQLTAQEPLPISDSLSFQEKRPILKRSEWLVPASLTGLSLFTLRKTGWGNKNDLQEMIRPMGSDFHVSFDDYLQFAPLAIAGGIHLFGLKGSSSSKQLAWKVVKSEFLMLGTAHLMKTIFKVERPDGSTTTAYPSGHTAQAFMAATVLHHEYGKGRPWLSITGYTIASTAAVLRVANNRHWVPDILLGAAVGMLSTHLVYGLAERKNQHISYLLPYVSLGRYGLYCSLTF